MAGGVGVVQLQCNVTIIDSSALNNTSQLGGAVYVISGCILHVERCQFIGCHVSSLKKYYASGGAIEVSLLVNLLSRTVNFITIQLSLEVVQDIYHFYLIQHTV